MSLVFQILLVVLALFGAIWLWDWLARRLSYRPRPDEIHYVTTSDGWRLAIARFRPRTAPSGRPPIIVCPGIGANGGMFDYPGAGENTDERDVGLVEWLCERGEDVWLAEVRGVGGSRWQPRSAPRDWTFDTLGEIDVPTIIDTVCDRTGADQVIWVGHSLGGMVLTHTLAAQAEGQTPRLAAAVWVASAVTFEHQPLLARAARVGGWLRYPRLPLRNPGRWLAPVGAILVTWPTTLLFRPRNIRPALRRSLLASIVEPIASGLLRQLATATRTGHLVSADGARNLVAPLAHNRVPLLLMAGSDDRIAPPAAVRHTAAAIGGPVEVVEIGEKTGASVDYGHGDLLMGTATDRDVYPHILSWLTRWTGEDGQSDGATL